MVTKYDEGVHRGRRSNGQQAHEGMHRYTKIQDTQIKATRRGLLLNLRTVTERRQPQGCREKGMFAYTLQLAAILRNVKDSVTTAGSWEIKEVPKGSHCPMSSHDPCLGWLWPEEGESPPKHTNQYLAAWPGVCGAASTWRGSFLLVFTETLSGLL